MSTLNPVTTPTRRRRRTLIIGLSAAITLILAGTAIAAAWLLGGTLADAKPAEQALPPETQIECTTIRREFDAWDRDITRLDSMVKTATTSTQQAVVKYELDQLRDAGNAFAKAVKGYADKPSKELSVAVATYNFDLSLVILEQQLMGGAVKDASKDKAIKSAAAVEQAYQTFAEQTCGKK